MCLNSDDWLESACLYNYLQFVSKYRGNYVFYWKVKHVFEDNSFNIMLDSFYWLRKFLFNNFWCNILVNHPAVLLKKSIYIELGMFDESKKICSDYGLWLKCLVEWIKFIYYPHIITNFRVHEWSISSKNENQDISDKELKYFQKKYLPRYKRVVCDLILWGWKMKHWLSVLLH